MAALLCFLPFVRRNARVTICSCAGLQRNSEQCKKLGRSLNRFCLPVRNLWQRESDATKECSLGLYGWVVLI